MALPGITSESRHAPEACRMYVISSQHSKVFFCYVSYFSISTQEEVKGQAAVHGSKETLCYSNLHFLLYHRYKDKCLRAHEGGSSSRRLKKDNSAVYTAQSEVYLTYNNCTYLKFCKWQALRFIYHPWVHPSTYLSLLKHFITWIIPSPS